MTGLSYGQTGKSCEENRVYEGYNGKDIEFYKAFKGVSKLQNWK